MENSKSYPIILTGGFLLVALTVFLLLDLMAAFSVYRLFSLLYTTFWALLAAVLLRHQPKRNRLLVLSLFLAAMLAIYTTNWDSRKAFLKDFQRIEAGMTTAQVDQMMQGFIKFVAPATQLDEQGQVIAGMISYRHTDEGWGDSDIGLVVIRQGRVVQTEFYPD